MKHIYAFNLSASINILVRICTLAIVFFILLSFFFFYLFIYLFIFVFLFCLFGWSTNIPRKNTLCSPLCYKLRFFFVPLFSVWFPIIRLTFHSSNYFFFFFTLSSIVRYFLLRLRTCSLLFASLSYRKPYRFA